jgi:signal transduction histidine kinase
MRDVSSQVEQERRMVEWKWQIEAGRKAHAIAKDLEYALHPMLLAQELLKPSGDSRHAQMEAWETLHRASEQATLLLRQFTRTAAGPDESPDIRVFDLQVCLMEVLESFHLNRGTLAGVEVDLAPGPSPVRGPVNLVRRSFELLIQRALDAAGGVAPVQVVSQQEPDRATVQIRDPGHGQSEASLHRMFDPLFCLPGDAAADPFGMFNVAQTLQTMGGEASVARTGRGWTEIALTFPLEGEP